jgi:WD40 repeat protein
MAVFLRRPVYRYTVDFHPTEPLLATASADCTVRIWTAKAKRVVHGFAD